MIFLVYTAVALVAILASSLRARGLTPITIFIGVFVSVVALYLLDGHMLRIFTYELSANAHLYIITNLVAFLIGSLSIWLTYGYRDKKSVTKVRVRRMWILTDWMLVVMAACVMARILTIVGRYGSLIAALPQVRNDYVSGSLTFPFWTSIATLVGNLIALNLGVAVGLGGRSYWRIIGFVGIALLNDSTTADKAGLRFIIMLIVTIYFVRMLIVRKRFSRGAYLGCAAFGLISATIYSTITFFRVVDQSASIFDVTVEHFYGNIAGNIGSSAWFLEHPWPRSSLGVYSFAGFYPLLGISRLEDHRQADFFNADIVSVGIYNTTDYMGYITADFGQMGCIITSGLMGLISAWLYIRAKHTGSAVHVQMLAFATAGLIMSFRGFYFGAPGFWLTLCLLGVQSVVIRTNLEVFRAKSYIE